MGMYDEVAGLKQELMQTIYTPEELVVLCEWFHEPPFALSRRDEDGFVSRVTAADVAEEMGFDESNDSSFASSVGAAVACIAADRCEEKSTVLLRAATLESAGRFAPPSDRVAIWDVMSIDWGWVPGSSTGEEYTLAWFPGFECFALIVGGVEERIFGFSEFAIAEISNSEDLIDEVKENLVDWWSTQRCEWDLSPWTLAGTGIVDAETARSWRDEAWSTDEVDDDDDDAQSTEE